MKRFIITVIILLVLAVIGEAIKINQQPTGKFGSNPNPEYTYKGQ